MRNGAEFAEYNKFAHVLLNATIGIFRLYKFDANVVGKEKHLINFTLYFQVLWEFY